MFARHPAVAKEAEKIIKADGKSITKEIAEKIAEWCSKGTTSPRDYWEFKQILLDGKDQLVDAYGADRGKKSKAPGTITSGRFRKISLSQGSAFTTTRCAESAKQPAPMASTMQST